MAFLRIKEARGRSYAYLVENRWDRRTNQSRQKVLGYLGRVDRVDPAALPERHRTPEILRALSGRRDQERARLQAAAERLRPQFLEALLRGDVPRAQTLARAALRQLGEAAFFDGVLSEAMHELGRRWAAGELSISREHLASGVVVGLLTEFNAAHRPKALAGPEVVLCVPDGEQHTLPLLLAERPLTERGFLPVNIGSSAPTGSIVEFVKSRGAYGTLVSVTQPNCLPAARELLRRLRREVPLCKVAVGGQALLTPGADLAIEGVDAVRSSLVDYLARWSVPQDGGESAATRSERYNRTTRPSNGRKR